MVLLHKLHTCCGSDARHSFWQENNNGGPEGKLMLKPDFEGIQACLVCKKTLSFKPDF